MTLAILMCGVLTVLCVVIAVLLFKGADNLLGEVEPRATWDVDAQEITQSAPAIPATSGSITATPITRIRLVSDMGRTLGETTITTKRRVSLQYRVGKMKALSNFVASHRDEDGVWVYRRVGVERE